MSTGTKAQVLLPAYDPQELRRRMIVCFTIGEMCALADKLQVPQVPTWSNNPQEAARDIVRHFDRSGALAFLVEALREAKPLVEWPEPIPLAIPPAPPPAATASAPAPAFSPSPARPAPPPPSPSAAPPSRGAPGTGVAGGSTILGVPSPQALEYADTALEAPHGDRPTPITDVPVAMLEAATPGASTPPAAPLPPPTGFAPSVMPRPGESPPPAPSAPAPTQAVTTNDALPDPLRSAPAPKPRAAWPGTAQASSDAPKKLPDPRILMAIGAGILLVLIGIAFLAGRASSGPVASGSATTDAAAGPPPDRVPIAQTAADALGTSLLRVAKACQIDPSSLRGRSLFEVAYLRCGPLPESPSQPSGPRPATSNYDPIPDPIDPGIAAADPTAAAGPKGNRPTVKGNKPQPADLTPPAPGGGGSGCLTNCQRNHSSCISRCGPEPQQGSQYDSYVSCHSGCLKALSQCKMGCN